MHDEKDMIEINLNAAACEATASSCVKNIRAMKFKNPTFHKADGVDDLLQREGNTSLGGHGPRTNLRRLYCADCQQRLEAESARFVRILLCFLPVVPISLFYRHCWRRGKTGSNGICKDCDRNLGS